MHSGTLAVLAVSTATVSMTTAAVAFVASPRNWWLSVLLVAVAVAILVSVARRTRDRDSRV